MRVKRFARVAVAALAVTAFAACGDDDDTEDPAGTDVPGDTTMDSTMDSSMVMETTVPGT